MKLIAMLVIYVICFIGITVMLTEEDTFKIISSSSITHPVLSENMLYDYYSSLERPQTLNYMIYVLDEQDDKFIESYIKENIIEFENYSETPFYIAEIIRQIPYSRDADGEEYPRYPVETIIDNTGDCEDKSILCASILKSLGYEVCLYRFDNHMSMGVMLDNESYTYIDATNYVTVTSIDDLHESYIMYTEDSPILLHDWNEAYVKHTLYQTTLTLSVMMENRGVNDEQVIFSVQVYNDGCSFYKNETLFIHSGEIITFQMVNKIPFYFLGNIQTKILVDNIVVDERGGSI